MTLVGNFDKRAARFDTIVVYRFLISVKMRAIFGNGGGEVRPICNAPMALLFSGLGALGCGVERVPVGSFEQHAAPLSPESGTEDAPFGLASEGQAPGFYSLPAGYTPVTRGGYKLGAPVGQTLPGTLIDADASGSNHCTGTILGVIRDFRRGDRPGGHPDFETFTGGGELGIVQPQLGDDSKPVYVDTAHQFTTNKTNFDQWYRNVPDVNLPFFLYLVVEPNNGVFTFDSHSFFPLDDQGFGDEGLEHNFAFTTEVHTTFLYGGGETFTFSGDDDLWVFINRQLAIDLGGVHPPQSKQIILDQEADALGISKGGLYALDLFNAERHSHESNFRIDTNIEFVNCAIVVDVR